MKSILLQFAETPTMEDIDFSLVEYDPELNLNVLKNTKVPAINFTDSGTETFTKTTGEDSDADRNVESDLSYLLDTSTQTRVINEVSDEDRGNPLANLMATTTITLVNSEASDSDKDFNKLHAMLATRTFTKISETSDTD